MTQSIPQQTAASLDAKDTHGLIKPLLILDGVTVPCQLLALASPPSLGEEKFVYATLSTSLVGRITRSTMSGAKAAAKRAAALGYTGEPVASSKQGDEAREEMAPITATRLQSPFRRFNFAEEDIRDFVYEGLPSASPAKKFILGSKSKDDGSGWTVEYSAPSLGMRRYQTPRHSGSSWGGGTALLQPICNGKLDVNKPVKLSLPRPGAKVDTLYDQDSEPWQLHRDAVRSVF